MLLGLGAYVFMSMIDVEIVLKKWKWVLAFNLVFIGLLLTPLGWAAPPQATRPWLKIPRHSLPNRPGGVVKITLCCCWLSNWSGCGWRSGT